MTTTTTALEELSKAIEKRVDRALKNEDDLLNFAKPVISARDNLKRVRSGPSKTRILDVVAADAAVRGALCAIIAERLVEVSE